MVNKDSLLGNLANIERQSCSKSALQQNRAQSRLLYLFCDKESNNFPTLSAEFSNQTLFSKGAKVASACSVF